MHLARWCTGSLVGASLALTALQIAVDFCHKKGKVNRDIKLANILLLVGVLCAACESHEA